MISKIQQCIAGIAFTLMLLFGTYQKGKKSGKQQAEAEQNEEIIQAQQRINEAGHLSNDDVAERLRNGDF